MKKNLRLPAALIMSLMLVFGLTAAPAAAASQASKSQAPVVKEVDYDSEDHEVEFEFKGKVKWDNPTVKITRNGKNYVKRIKSRDNNDIEVKVKKMKEGVKYSYTITGVKKKGADSYCTVTGTFTAYDD